MNDIKTALVKAGLPLRPTNERVWRLLKDMPHIDYKRVASMLNVSENTVSSALNDLTARGMVQMSRALAPAGKRRGRCTFEALGREFELLPRPRRGQPPPAPVPAVVPSVAPAPAKEWTADDHVNSLTLRQAKAVYEYLKGVFG